MDLYSEIKSKVAQILEVQPEKIEAETNFMELGMDSFNSIELLSLLEKNYKIDIPEESLPRLMDLKSTVDVVSGLLK